MTAADSADKARGPFGLEGRVAMVTGASGGLGRHFARILAGAGAAVVVAARRAQACEETAAAIKDSGGRAVAVSLDVTDPDRLGPAFDAATAALGPDTVLINNDGVAESRMILDMDSAEWDRVLETNLKGAWLVAREAARRMIDGETGGAIVNIASITAHRPAVGLGAYGASKAALVHLTRTMAVEWARHGIRVNALAPGYIETDLNRKFLTGEGGRKMKGRIPQRRFGHMEDLDGPLLLLASGASAYMTGAVVTVDGGHSAAAL